MNFGEVYEPLQTGAPMRRKWSGWSSKLNRDDEAAKTIILTQSISAAPLLFVEPTQVQRPAGGQQKALSTPVRKRRSIQRKRENELNADAVERMKAKGTTFVTPDKAGFIALIAPIRTKVANQLKMIDVLHTGARSREVMRADALLTASWRQVEQRVMIRCSCFSRLHDHRRLDQVVMRYVFRMSFLWARRCLCSPSSGACSGGAGSVSLLIHLGFDFLPTCSPGGGARRNGS